MVIGLAQFGACRVHSRVICISGCASGIGRALALRLAEQGATVYAGMRELSTAPVLNGVRALQLDVTLPGQITRAMAVIARECGKLDVLINNAGVNALGPWELVPAEIVRRTFEVNFFGAVELTKAALPLMRRQRAGHVLVISSLSALVALPAGGVYAASKAALEAFAESLSYEVRRWNIRVSIVNPAGYASGLQAAAWRPGTAEGPYASLVDALGTQRHSAECGAEQAAARIIGLLSGRGERLRHPLDETARRVFGRLNWENGREREQIARDASGLGWWLDGSEAND